MKQILVFSGTTEGRNLAECLCGNGIRCTVCVATEYGERVMDKQQGLTIRQGRMNPEEMENFITAGEFLAVVDATHPFASVVSENIKKSMRNSRIPYLRLKRNTKEPSANQENILCFPDDEACAAALKETEGNILLATGSKHLAAYADAKELRPRLYVRVLPAMESIVLCNENGIAGKQILALQGPFSAEMNEAMIKQYDIRCMVTRESGSNGGFQEKIQAAENTGIKVMVIGNPEKTEGYTYEEVCRELEKLTGKRLEQDCRMQIALVGMGMGNHALLTKEADQRIKEADLIFGAERFLEDLPVSAEKLPYYAAKDIIPVLEAQSTRRPGDIWKKKAVVLFSGDTGFYSGAGKLFEELRAEIEAGRLKAEVKICPGISSVSYLAARLGTSWQEAGLLSIHGRAANVAETVKANRKTFLLVSGLEDMKELGSTLLEAGLKEVKITAGYRLSYPEERILALSPANCGKLVQEGLYVCLIENDRTGKGHLTHGLPDEAFIRGKVPMTREEVREVSICKLGLYQDAVLYDVGSGTGSVAAECARLGRIRVYAIEKKEEALLLIRQNCTKFDLHNVTVMKGEAPEAFRELPPPTHVFIGGSGGNMKSILEELYRKNPRLHIVINAVTLETIAEVMNLLKTLPAENEEIVQVQVSRADAAGRYHLMKAENPVYIISFNFKKVTGNCETTIV